MTTSYYDYTLLELAINLQVDIMADFIMLPNFIVLVSGSWKNPGFIEKPNRQVFPQVL